MFSRAKHAYQKCAASEHHGIWHYAAAALYTNVSKIIVPIIIYLMFSLLLIREAGRFIQRLLFKNANLKRLLNSTEEYILVAK